MDDTATKLGKAIKPLLKAGAVLPEEHSRYRFVRAIAGALSNVTMSFEQVYKLRSWLKNESDALPPAVEGKAIDRTNWTHLNEQQKSQEIQGRRGHKMRRTRV